MIIEPFNSKSILFKIKQILIAIIMASKRNFIRPIDLLQWSLALPVFINRFPWISSVWSIDVLFFSSLSVLLLLVFFVLGRWLFTLGFFSLIWCQRNVNKICVRALYLYYLWLVVVWMLGCQVVGMNCAFVFNQNIVIFLNVWVESVLDSVFWSSEQSFTDFGPSGSELCVKLNDFVIFGLGPLFTLDWRIELVDISFSDLFAGFSF